MPLAQSDIDRFKSLYIQTARAYANDMMRNMLLLKNNHEDADALGVLYMASHSLGSQSILMGYSNIGHFAATMESLFRAKKEKMLEFNDEMLELVDSAVKKIDASIFEIEKGGKEMDLGMEIQKLQEVIKLK